jgi:hypothetical protein
MFLPNRLFIILATNARLVGPALQINEAEFLIYTPAQAIFKYLGKIMYTVSELGRHRVAYV